MSIQETDERLLAHKDLEPIKLASPADAGFEIALHFYSFADGEEPAFYIKWFSLSDQHHAEIEANLLRELDIPLENVNRTEEKRCLKTVGNIGLFSWSDVDPETGRAHGAYYSAEPIEIS
ncbi:MAG TPA: hypothetical protein VLE69_02980 [Candidatus Saccharimonadales bacterium]|nr:hypothetical protein [Candidatus Saccharimonadales bacterium]